MYVNDKVATAQGFQNAIGGVSMTVVPAVAGSAVLVAWQYTILLYALALPAALVVYLWFDEPKIDGASSEAESLDTDGGPKESYARELGRLFSRPRMAAVILARALVTGVWTGFITYISIIVVRLFQGTSAQAGVIFAVHSLAIAVVSTQIGRLTARSGSRLHLLVAANLALIAGIGVFGLASIL